MAAGLAFGARLSAIPSECRANDRSVRERDEDLAQWVADEHVRLKRELNTLRDELAARGLFFSGAHTSGVALEKQRTLHSYRDQERQAKRDVAGIHDSERLLHRLWRFISRRRFPNLTTPQSVAPVIDAWRLPAKRHLGPEETPPPFEDPTRRTLVETLAEVAAGTEALT